MSKVQVTTHIFGPRFSETVLNELDPRYSRAEVPVAASEKPLAFGTVLARNADGVYAPLAAPVTKAEGENQASTPAAAPAPSAILIQDLPAGEQAQKALVLRGYCIVNGSRLLFADGVDKKSALVALEDAGFVIHDVPAEDWEEK